jgi:hypothetical protein
VAIRLTVGADATLIVCAPACVIDGLVADLIEHGECHAMRVDDSPLAAWAHSFLGELELISLRLGEK